MRFRRMTLRTVGNTGSLGPLGCGSRLRRPVPIQGCQWALDHHNHSTRRHDLLRADDHEHQHQYDVTSPSPRLGVANSGCDGCGDVAPSTLTLEGYSESGPVFGGIVFCIQRRR
jgi:hypothetical protein